ncbi:uncharacterized protein V1518DRAFT_422640 [Limtongia smithiae]|uniref:uncharacterized protein n=1 Tax=Limtongia smithiae TaxID=1125753 RepID=UPI0034CD3A3F
MNARQRGEEKRGVKTADEKKGDKGQKQDPECCHGNAVYFLHCRTSPSDKSRASSTPRTQIGYVTTLITTKPVHMALMAVEWAIVGLSACMALRWIAKLSAIHVNIEPPGQAAVAIYGHRSTTELIQQKKITLPGGLPPSIEIIEGKLPEIDVSCVEVDSDTSVVDQTFFSTHELVFMNDIKQSSKDGISILQKEITSTVLKTSIPERQPKLECDFPTFFGGRELIVEAKIKEPAKLEKSVMPDTGISSFSARTKTSSKVPSTSEIQCPALFAPASRARSHVLPAFVAPALSTRIAASTLVTQAKYVDWPWESTPIQPSTPQMAPPASYAQAKPVDGKNLHRSSTPVATAPTIAAPVPVPFFQMKSGSGGVAWPRSSTPVQPPAAQIAMTTLFAQKKSEDGVTAWYRPSTPTSSSTSTIAVPVSMTFPRTDQWPRSTAFLPSTPTNGVFAQVRPPTPAQSSERGHAIPAVHVGYSTLQRQTPACYATVQPVPSHYHTPSLSLDAAIQLYTPFSEEQHAGSAFIWPASVEQAAKPMTPTSVQQGRPAEVIQSALTPFPFPLADPLFQWPIPFARNSIADPGSVWPYSSSTASPLKRELKPFLLYPPPPSSSTTSASYDLKLSDAASRASDRSQKSVASSGDGSCHLKENPAEVIFHLMGKQNHKENKVQSPTATELDNRNCDTQVRVRSVELASQVKSYFDELRDLGAIPGPVAAVVVNSGLFDESICGMEHDEDNYAGDDILATNDDENHDDYDFEVRDDSEYDYANDDYYMENAADGDEGSDRNDCYDDDESKYYDVLESSYVEAEVDSDYETTENTVDRYNESSLRKLLYTGTPSNASSSSVNTIYVDAKSYIVNDEHTAQPHCQGIGNFDDENVGKKNESSQPFVRKRLRILKIVNSAPYVPEPSPPPSQPEVPLTRKQRQNMKKKQQKRAAKESHVAHQERRLRQYKIDVALHVAGVEHDRIMRSVRQRRRGPKTTPDVKRSAKKYVAKSELKAVSVVSEKYVKQEYMDKQDFTADGDLVMHDVQEFSENDKAAMPFDEDLSPQAMASFFRSIKD